MPEFNPYANAIARIESGGRYDVLGPMVQGQGQAHGKYQIMPANIGPWTREFLGREMTPAEFLASPEAQDAVFNGKFGQYVAKYGPGGAARAWFAGEGGMNNPNAADVNGMTVANYERKFLGAGAAPVAPTPPADDRDMVGYGGSPPPAMGTWDEGKKPFMAGIKPEDLSKFGVGLLASSAPQQSWQPQPIQAGSPYRSRGNALSLLGTLGQSGLLG